MAAPRDATPGPSTPDSKPLLSALGRRVLRLRRRQGRTRQQVAERSGISVRFLARVEGGDGNISVLRLESLARALGTTPDSLLRPEDVERRIVALVGLRGAGKSTVGPALAQARGVRFVEMDAMITEASGLPLDQLFELHGEGYYRRIERETLRHILAANRDMVVATAGGVVNEPVTWDLLRERATTVWLKARPEDHWNRVVAQGDRRPMADNPDAMDELRGILAARERLYSQADLTIDTSDLAPREVVERIRDVMDSPAP
jgi:XRE family aerobic/anaerobic benzoate catabolism transcriptional regulator